MYHVALLVCNRLSRHLHTESRSKIVRQYVSVFLIMNFFSGSRFFSVREAFHDVVGGMLCDTNDKCEMWYIVLSVMEYHLHTLTGTNGNNG